MPQEKDDKLGLLEPLVRDAVKWEAGNVASREGIDFEKAVASVLLDGDLLSIVKSYKTSYEYKDRHRQLLAPKTP